MSSLIKHLFETMPLAGAMGAALRARATTKPTISQLADYLQYRPSAPATSTGQQTQSDPNWPPVTAPMPTFSAGHYKLPPSQTPIWSYTHAGPAKVTGVKCRVKLMDYAEFDVLDEIRWGFMDRTTMQFQDAVRIHLQGDYDLISEITKVGPPVTLELTSDYHLLSFTVGDGSRGGGRNEAGTGLWPLSANHDRSFVHVFAYDIHRTETAALSPRSLKASSHPDKIKVDKMLLACKALNAARGRFEPTSIEEVLFQDNLWVTPAAINPTAIVGTGETIVYLTPIRVLVAVSLTPHLYDTDFQPGVQMGAGRLYPHVAVAATFPLSRVEAAVRLTRPEKSHSVPDMTHHSMSGMLTGVDDIDPKIHSLLVTDTNAGNLVVSNHPTLHAPVVIWANLFNYYVPDPVDDPSIGKKPIQVAYRFVPKKKFLPPATKNGPRTTPPTTSLVRRDCSDLSKKVFLNPNPDGASQENGKRVTKKPRQGAFDNIHIAVRMKVKTGKINRVSRRHDTLLLPPTVKFYAFTDDNISALKMDEIIMAPFCAHDCFHMHWRWSDNANDERGAQGFGSATTPHTVPGAVMVPPNQDVWLAWISTHAFNYIAEATDTPALDWQIFCHHGTAYGLDTSWKVDEARDRVSEMDDLKFWDGQTEIKDSWALFYWRMRYRLDTSDTKITGATQRFSFLNEKSALDL